MIRSSQDSIDFRRLFSIIVVVLFASFASTAIGQDKLSEGRNKVTRLDLDFVFALPGDRIFLVLSLEAPARVSIGSVASEISFPTEFLSFKSATRGASAAAVDAVVSTKMQRDPEDADKAILEVKVSPQGKSSLKALPNGGVANLTFQISLDAEIGTNISLENKVRAWTTGVPPKRVEPVSGGDGQVHLTTESMAIFSCLFYMH